MQQNQGKDPNEMSPPVRGRGLKSLMLARLLVGQGVAPCAGAWVEMEMPLAVENPSWVAPCAGGVG